MATNDTSKEITRLHKQRGNLKRILTNLESKLSQGHVSIPIANMMMQELQDMKDKFAPIQVMLDELTEEDENQAKKEDREAVDFYQRCMVVKEALAPLLFVPPHPGNQLQNLPQDQEGTNINVILNNQTDIMQQIVELHRSSADQSTRRNAGTRMKLPELTIPKFDKKYTEWLSFRDIFKSLVHDNDDVKPVMKMVYLQRSLVGEAAAYISHVEPTEANYEPTWQRLLDRYEKKTHLVNALITEFLAQSKMKVESVTDLLKASSKYRQIIDSLKSLGDECMSLDIWLIHMMKLNMSQRFRTKWEEGRDTETMAKLDEFFEFMSQQGDIMERAAQDSTSSTSTKPNIKSHHTEVLKCCKCGGEHPLYSCDQFKAASVDERRHLTAGSNICFNCLRVGHSARKCMSKSRCRECNKGHHTLLHLFQDPPQASSSSEPIRRPQDNAPNVPQVNASSDQRTPQSAPSNANQNTRIITHHSSAHHRALLSTAIVNIKDVYGDYQQCRVLIDGGGECTMVSEDCAQRLSLPRQHARIPVTGAGEVAVGYTRGLVNLEISSVYDENDKIHAEAYVMQKVTSQLPPVALEDKTWRHITALRLADPQFKTPGKIDVILGAEYALAINLPQILKGNEGEPVAQLTIFGWIVGGKVSGQVRSFTSLHTQCDVNLNETLKRFWEVESVPPTVRAKRSGANISLHLGDIY